MKTEQYIITIERPKGVSKTQLKNYIREELSGAYALGYATEFVLCLKVKSLNPKKEI